MELGPLADGVSTQLAVWLALVSALALAALHLAAPWIRRLPGIPEQAIGSFAGGIAVSYVFLHLLPEIARGHTELRELFEEEPAPSLLTELGIFLVALLGFVVFYGLERAAAGRHTARGPDRPVYRLHLGAFVIYNGIITYTLPLTYRTGVGYAVLFTIAMGLHFVLSDRGLEEHYGRWFDRWPPRLLLGAALLAGWLLAALFAPTQALTVSLLVAFLSGSVLLNVFKSELPSARQSSFGWFFAGLTLYAALLAAVTYAGSATTH